MAFNLDQIGRLRKLSPPIIFLYGVEGIGKSTFASRIPSSVYCATEQPGPVEANFAQWGNGEIVAPDMQSVFELMRALLTQEHDYRVFIIDSITAFERMIWKQVATDKGKESIEDIGYGKGYQFAVDYWSQFIQLMNKLRDTRSMASLMIGHVQVAPFADPMGESYDQYMPRIHKGASPELRQRSDAVLFASYKTYLKKEGEGTFKERNIAKTTGRRILHTVEHPAYLAKNRYNMPDEIEFSWDSVMEHIKSYYATFNTGEVNET